MADMRIQSNVSLAQYSTMRLGGTAAFLCEISSEADLLEALAFADKNNLRTHLVGSGSNSIFGAGGYKGLIIVNRILGVTTEEDTKAHRLTVGAGENWDMIVQQSVALGYVDIALLSLIPGTVGAAPVQNIGAYGQQISDSIISMRAYDTKNKAFVELTVGECAFAYRTSRFNKTEKSRFIITNIKLRLYRKNIEEPLYADIERYLSNHNIASTSASPEQLREATSKVRVIKLPDPCQVANCGSFFKNPVVSKGKFAKLLQDFPDLKAHKTDDGNLKLYGAQLIELCGLKDIHDDATGMATWKNQALVLVNEHARTTLDLIKFKELIVEAVQQKFDIILVQEPELVELV